VFVMNPPRQFPSKTAMLMFLEENPDIKAKHEAFANPVVAPTAASTSASAVREGELEYI